MRKKEGRKNLTKRLSCNRKRCERESRGYGIFQNLGIKSMGVITVIETRDCSDGGDGAGMNTKALPALSWSSRQKCVGMMIAGLGGTNKYNFPASDSSNKV